MDDLGDNLLRGWGGSVGVDAPVEDRTDLALGWLMGWCMRVIVLSALAMVAMAATGQPSKRPHPIIDPCADEECITIPLSEFRRVIEVEVERQRKSEEVSTLECWRLRT